MNTSSQRLYEALSQSKPNLSQQALNRLLDTRYGISGELSPLSGEREQNVRVRCSENETYVLKISREADEGDRLSLQNCALNHLAQVAPDLCVPRVIRTRDEESMFAAEHLGTRYLVRLLTFLPGEPILSHKSAPPAFLCQLGAIVAKLDTALVNFNHEEAQTKLVWDLEHALELGPQIRFVADAHHRALAGR